ncbi:MAG: Gfo/Idh/MocA family oxidoreductase, partial [Spirochaetales bacterium]
MTPWPTQAGRHHSGMRRRYSVKKTRVAFIGAGQFANVFHYPTLSEMDDVELVAIADLNPELLSRTADAYGVPGRYADYQEMLEKETIDAVYVIMKPAPLEPIVLDVLSAGKHVFTEKPLGLTIEQTRRLAAAAHAAGVKTQVGTNRRFSRVLRTAKDLVLERGPISMVVGEFHKDMESEQFDMEVMHSDALHVLDPLRYLAGEPVSVHSHADRWYRKTGWAHSHNVYSAFMRFDSGATGVFLANRQSGTRFERFEIHGDGIVAYVHTPDIARIFTAGNSDPLEIHGKDLAG